MQRLPDQHLDNLKYPIKSIKETKNIQSNLNRSNTDGSLTMANSNSVLSP